MNVSVVFRRLGFTTNQTKIYLKLNDYGSLPAGKLAKLSKLDRSSVYNGLQELLDKGLVSYAIIGGVKWFQATGPQRLLEVVKAAEEDVRAILPELQARHKLSKPEGQMRLFKGLRGVKSIFMDIIRAGENNYVFGSEGQLSQRAPSFAKQFDRLKREKGIQTKMIIRQGQAELDVSTTLFRHVSGIPESPAVTNIYGDKVAIIIWTQAPEGIILENAAVAKAYKSYFELMWKQGS